jgi:hypothetical protein
VLLDGGSCGVADRSKSLIPNIIVSEHLLQRVRVRIFIIPTSAPLPVHQDFHPGILVRQRQSFLYDQLGRRSLDGRLPDDRQTPSRRIRIFGTNSAGGIGGKARATTSTRRTHGANDAAKCSRRVVWIDSGRFDPTSTACRAREDLGKPPKGAAEPPRTTARGRPEIRPRSTETWFGEQPGTRATPRRTRAGPGHRLVGLLGDEDVPGARRCSVGLATCRCPGVQRPLYLRPSTPRPGGRATSFVTAVWPRSAWGKDKPPSSQSQGGNCASLAAGTTFI